MMLQPMATCGNVAPNEVEERNSSANEGGSRSEIAKIQNCICVLVGVYMRGDGKTVFADEN